MFGHYVCVCVCVCVFIFQSIITTDLCKLSSADRKRAFIVRVCLLNELFVTHAEGDIYV
jgi:hypothetical protein